MMYSMALVLCPFLLCMIGDNEVGGFLIVPEDADLCLNRPKHWRWHNETTTDTTAEDGPHYYFYSNDVREYRDQKYDWLAARNLCRQYCMDAVSIESFNENQMLYSFMDQRGLLLGRQGRLTVENNITRYSDDQKCGPNHPNETDAGYSYWLQCNADSEYYCCNKNGDCKGGDLYQDCHCLDCINFKEPIKDFWTSGRKCDFAGCETMDLEPILVKGWFWSGSKESIHSTNETDSPEWHFNPWGKTGHFNTAQPDNAEEEVSQVPESCLAIAKDLYDDGIQWHDISCYHSKPVICEDSYELLESLNVQ